MLRQCCCDPHKLTYISAVITSVEALLFGALNVVLLCMNTCVIQPPDDLSKYHLDIDRFWAWYFFEEGKCADRYSNYTAPEWVSIPFPIVERRPQTTVDANYRYQFAYLVLHASWFIASLILIYGNARKLRGSYVPWLLLTLALIVMDLTIGVFYIEDMSDAGKNYRSAMFWIFAMYMRIFIFWFMNLSELATVFNAFCKTHHKRSKQARKERSQKKKQSEEVDRAAAAADAAARAELAEQHQRAQGEQLRSSESPGIDNEAYKPEPPPKPRAKAPPELRPFNYLNPSYRPEDQHDLEGMRANASPNIEVSALERNKPFDVSVEEEEDYFPTTVGHRGGDLPPVGAALRRHGSLRNYNTREPHLALRRFSSTRGPPRPAYYNNDSLLYPTPDYNELSDAKALLRSIEKLQPLPRVNLLANKASLHAQRDDIQSSGQGRPLSQRRSCSPPPSQHRPYPIPPDQIRPYSPTNQIRPYFPQPSQSRPYSPPPSQSRPYAPPPGQSRPYAPPPSQRSYPLDSSPKVVYI